ncbi:MAG: HEAT repeat domain-containing protein [Candidatus Limnocylindrales bacterium]|jgi:HEAT repeat protein
MPLFGPPNIAQLEAKRDISGLIKALTYKDPSVRVAAADALGPMKDPMAVEPLSALIQDDNAEVRRAAVRALAARGGVRVVEPLIAALGDRDPGVRSVAASAVYRRLMTDPDQDARRATAVALGRIRAADAVEPLVKSILDADDSVRVASIKSLGAIGNAAAVGPLIVALAHEQARGKATGRSSLAVERAAGQALDLLCDERAIEPLQAMVRHDDPEVREIAVRRLAHLTAPAVAGSLADSLDDPDPVIRRAAARGLLEIGWEPPSDEVGARYWAALRDWRRCAACGPAAVPLLRGAFPRLDALEQSDIIAALAAVGWQPTEADAMAAHFWAAQGEWDKCVEIGAPAVEVLRGILRGARTWRDRVPAAAALKALGDEQPHGFGRVDLVQQALRIMDGEGTDDEKRAALQALVAEERLVASGGRQHIEWCACGYPAMKARKEGTPEPIGDLLAFELDGSGSPSYFCPSCDASQTTATQAS